MGRVKGGPAHLVGEGGPPLDLDQTFAGRRILITGATGFVGKVVLSMLLHRFPSVGRVLVLVRPGAGGTAEARFFGKIVPSRPFDPLRSQHGRAFDRFMREKCLPLAGDVSSPLLGLTAEDLQRLEGLDLVLNVAGLVDFNPSLELALSVNVEGPRNAAALCERTGAALVQVSTCFVAGNRDGVVFEDEEIRGFFPRREGVTGRPKQETLDSRDFDLEAEIADCRQRIAQTREAAEDRTLLSEFRRRGLERLRAEGRDPADDKALRLAAGREKRLWISQRLVELGMDRARHWGWQNTYTFTKSLGEQLVAASRCCWAIARPSITESALRYPFPGWNEGFTTSAPLAFLALKGHRSYPGAEKAMLDVVPVDLVAAGLLAIGAELLDEQPPHPCPLPLRGRGDDSASVPSPRSRGEGQGEGLSPGESGFAPTEPGRVYHLASGDVNPFWVRRCIELLGIYQRRFFRRREEGSKVLNRLLSHLEPYPVSRRRYQTFSAPALARLTRAAGRLIREQAPDWGAPRLSALAGQVANQLDEVQNQLERTRALFELYMPFVWDNHHVFRCTHIRELRARLSPADRERLPWDPERIDWRSYWLDVHMKGMEEWVFPGLEEEARKKVHPVKAHRDLLELLESACQSWKNRVALRMSGQRKEIFTYGDLRNWSDRVAWFLLDQGITPGDRVLLAAENRPEWAIAYFGILKAGAVAVPVDSELSAAEIANLYRTAGAKLVLLSDLVLERLADLSPAGTDAGTTIQRASLCQALSGSPPRPLARSTTTDSVASLLFTSGTTGVPKGIMLTHRNFASLVAKLTGIFDLGPGDGLLSVLPLHHSFEFTCGLLVPLSRGAEIEYLDELTADTIGDALEEGRVTAMVGVPALWSLLHRRLTQELAAQPGAAEQAIRQLMKASGAVRDRWSMNLGKLLFWPIHRKLGGRLRYLISGSSALSPEVQRAFHELGFDLYQGYGLTESAPALSVSTPAEVEVRETEDPHSVQTAGELAQLVTGGHARGVQRSSSEMDTPREIDVPAPVAALGRRFLRVAQRVLYRRAYATQVRGLAYVPRDRNFLVVANHASHLDMGLVKVALGEAGEKLCALAASDYFFDTPLKRAYFGNFTNLIPMDRSGSVRRSLRAAEEALRRGFNLLIFPEGTRSRDGTMAPFKPTAGYLALTSGLDVLPIYLRGTRQALPKGSVLPRPAHLEVIIGPPLPVEELRRRTARLPRGVAHKQATRIMEEAVRRLGGEISRDTNAENTDSSASATPTVAATESVVGSGTVAESATGTVAGSVTVAGTGAASASLTDSMDSTPLLAKKGDE